MANDDTVRQRTPNEVQREISETRAELDQTLDEIGRRLSPQEIKERVMDSAKETVAEVRDTVQQNTRPLLVAGGIAAAALLLHSHWQARQVETRADQVRDLWDRFAYSLSTHAHDGRGQIGTTLSDVAGTVSDAAQSARETVHQAMSDVMPKVARTARDARALMDDVPAASLWTFGLSLASALLMNVLARRTTH